MKKGLVWFRNNLRIHDNQALFQAAEECDEVLCVYVIDRKWLEPDPWGHIRLGSFRAKFLLESLEQLQHGLQDLGGDLRIVIGDPADSISSLATKYHISNIYGNREYASEEVEAEQKIGEEFDLRLFHDSLLIEPEALPFTPSATPDIFTQFRKKAEKYAEVAQVIPSPNSIHKVETAAREIPTLSDLGLEVIQPDPRGVMKFKGGFDHAKKRLEHYFWQTKSLSDYKETRNGLIGADYSSKFSPWLANGCISPREIYWQIKSYEQEVEKNNSTYWLVFELLWRDYFKYVAMKYGRKIFFPGGIKEEKSFVDHDEEKFASWKAGKTGQPFIDANMRELALTGFMSNRGRQNVASYLVHALNLDWRMGASWFESQLIDYDPCSNYGNWIYLAGVGNDPRENRVFNPERQSEYYDSEGKYRSLWNKAE